jgi:ABC-type transport system substrate-binding protein
LRVLASLAIAVVFAAASALAQTNPNAPGSLATATPPVTIEESDDKAWSFSASALSYIEPDSRNYVQPTFTADRGWLHLEARYNYEALDTGSAWVGCNFSEQLYLHLVGADAGTGGVVPVRTRDSTDVRAPV